MDSIIKSWLESGFYYDVLNPILQDFMIKNADIEDRIPEYRKARDAFSKQLEVVSSLQSQLKSYGDISLKAHQLCASFEQIRANKPCHHQMVRLSLLFTKNRSG